MTLEETIAHHRWCADNCEGEVRDEHLQMVAWLEELVELRVWNSEFGCSMNDYNRGALKEPCLRLPYGFGEEWASVELGDGTGYVKLADYEKLKTENDKLLNGFHAMQQLYEDELKHALAENAELRQERDHWRVEQVHAYGNWEDAYKRSSELESENAKLREYAESYAKAVECEGCGWCPYDMDAVCDTETMSMRDGCKLYDELCELGVKAR